MPVEATIPGGRLHRLMTKALEQDDAAALKELKEWRENKQKKISHLLIESERRQGMWSTLQRQLFTCGVAVKRSRVLQLSRHCMLPSLTLISLHGRLQAE